MLQFENISKRFTDTPVIETVSFSLEPGSTVLVTGESGVGKTTLLRLIAGLDRPDSGDIRWKQTVWSNGAGWVPPWERNVAMVFQDLALWPHMHVNDHLLYAQSRHKERSRKQKILTAAETLEGLNLSGLETRYPHELSGGQQQRVAIARALVAEPEILLLDEPFSNLDKVLEQSVWALIRDCSAKVGQTVLMVSHDPEPYLPEVSCQLEVRTGIVTKRNGGTGLIR